MKQYANAQWIFQLYKQKPVMKITISTMYRRTQGQVRADTRSQCPGKPHAGAPIANPTALSENPLLVRKPKIDSYPPFQAIQDGHYLPAFAQGMAEQTEEISRIASNPESPTFANTVEAMEASGQLLAYVSSIFFNIASSCASPSIEKIEVIVAPELSTHEDKIFLNPALFKRIAKLYATRDDLAISQEQHRLLEKYYKRFVRAGAHLSPEDKEVLHSINERIATLEIDFHQRLLKTNEEHTVIFDAAEDLSGLPKDAIQAAYRLATEIGHKGKYAVRLQNTTQQPILVLLTKRESRLAVLQASCSRGAKSGDSDTRPVILELANLRAKRAALLEYPNHAAYVLADSTAQSTAAVDKLIRSVTRPAVKKALGDRAKLQALLQQELPATQLEDADWQYYAEKLKTKIHAYDERQVAPYLELDNVVKQGVFFAATKLYGLQFSQRDDLPTYHPDVRVYEVFNEDNSVLGLFLADYYARPGKQGGAWMSSFLSQSKLLQTAPIVVNNLNINKPEDGVPTLLTFDEVITLFHEFGHALHGLFSNVTYPSFSGTNVPHDIVEYPSQINEIWALCPDVFGNYAYHYRTGEPIPGDLIAKILAADKFNQGFALVEYLGAAVIDQAWHRLANQAIPDVSDIEAFENRALHDAGIKLDEIPPRYRSSYFSHIFDGGYSAGYYAYLWSEVLVAATAEWFRQHGGLQRRNGERFRQLVLSRGGAEDIVRRVNEFLGTEPDVKALLRKRGLAE